MAFGEHLYQFILQLPAHSAGGGGGGGGGAGGGGEPHLYPLPILLFTHILTLSSISPQINSDVV